MSSHWMRVSVQDVRAASRRALRRRLRQWTEPVGVLLEESCGRSEDVLRMASESMLFDSTHSWLVFLTENGDGKNSTVSNAFENLHLSVDADVIAVTKNENHYELTDVFNFGKIQGNPLEIRAYGAWSSATGLEVALEGFKYYSRWDFHNLTLRAVSVVLGRNMSQFDPGVLSEARFSAGVSAMTKTAALLLDVFMEQHNFRLNYTIVDRWVGNPKRNSTMAVTNTLFWREQDISVTCIRIFPQWLKWMDPFFPPTTFLETKFYYLIPNSGVGSYENRFLTPLAPGVWATAAAAAAACGAVLAAAARVERRPQPASYALFSVVAAACQQAYEDGVHLMDDTISSQGGRAILLVSGLSSMLIYNYYTSSVVSWLLNAAAPTIAALDGLISSPLELTFEDIGYTRQWLDGPGFYYYAGFKWDKEDELRDKKVKQARRSVPLLQDPADGINLVRTGRYAYHTEPYTASQIISPSFDERELCALGSLQMMPRQPVYIVGQKRSPYRQFFVWSVMRAMERGHVALARRRTGGEVPGCGGRTPRALALGQAAPAFAVLAAAMVLSLCMLAGEVAYHRYEKKTSVGGTNAWLP
ncbi:hypothetical protein JYU34_017026 [Plutella xylostella]|uniref:Ionotropic receptor 75a N-terminal domain-containing protein n=1 Tax=Plutella xylostella TaxID=51655 RepID=A0ABQ7Q4D4_PLUXY|nr:hypothetical protein JYU34_017026 [Plutella xylostella]